MFFSIRNYRDALKVRGNFTNIGVAATHLNGAARARRRGDFALARQSIATARKARLECRIFAEGQGFRKAVI